MQVAGQLAMLTSDDASHPCGKALHQPVYQGNLLAGVLHTFTSQGAKSTHQPVR